MENISLSTQCVCIENNNAWIFSDNYNALFRMDLCTHKIEYITSFMKENFFGSSLYTKAIYYKEKIVFVPCCANNIAVFDLRTENVRYIPLEKNKKDIPFNTITYDDQVLMYPTLYSRRAYEFNFITEKLRVISLDFGRYDNKLFQHTLNILFCGEAYREGVAYFAIYGTNVFIKFYIETGCIDFCKMQSKELLYKAYIWNKNIVFLTLDGTKFIIKSDVEKVRPLIYSAKKNVFSNGNFMPYTQFVAIDTQNFTFVPVQGNELPIFSLGIENLIEICWDKIKTIRPGPQPFVVIQKNGENLYFFPYQSATMIVLDLSTKNIQYVDCYIRQSVYENIIRKYMQNVLIQERDNLVIAEETLALELFLELLPIVEQFNCSADGHKEYGKVIYKNLLENNR
jgi:hypothetical protein